jgi:hypothetical protein
MVFYMLRELLEQHMNLINFHTYDKNKQYICEYKRDILGQGLINTYDILLFGNKHNKYTLDIEHDNKPYKLYIDEMHLLKWSIRSKNEDGTEEFDYLEINALGNFNNEGYFWVNQACRYEHTTIEVHNTIFKVTDITVTNDHVDIPFIKSISNCYSLIDLNEEQYKEIHKITEFNKVDQELLKKLKHINFPDWNKEPNKIYYLVSEYYFYPIQVISDNTNILTVDLCYNNNLYRTDITLEHIEFEDSDKYNIKLKHDIIVEPLGIIHKIDDYFFIAE